MKPIRFFKTYLTGENSKQTSTALRGYDLGAGVFKKLVERSESEMKVIVALLFAEMQLVLSK